MCFSIFCCEQRGQNSKTARGEGTIFSLRLFFGVRGIDL